VEKQGFKPFDDEKFDINNTAEIGRRGSFNISNKSFGDAQPLAFIEEEEEGSPADVKIIKQ